MKRILLFIFLFYHQGIFGQLEFRNSNVGRLVNMEDISGQSLLKKYDPEITGSPFLNDNWTPAAITLSKGKQITPLQIKINLESNELYFLDTVGKEMIAVNGLVRRVEFINLYSRDSVKYVFKSGYPAVDKQNEIFFYQVLTEGKMELLAKKSKYISVVKDGFTGETKKSFEDAATVLYVCIVNTMHVTRSDGLQVVYRIEQFRPNKSVVLSLLSDKEQMINTFLDTNKINLKKTSDLIKLFSYYNELQ